MQSRGGGSTETDDTRDERGRRENNHDTGVRETCTGNAGNNRAAHHRTLPARLGVTFADGPRRKIYWR